VLSKFGLNILKLNNYEIKKVLKVVLLVFAFLIGFFSLWYTNTLVEKLEIQEREKIETWASATKEISITEGDVSFLFKIIEANTTIPVIHTTQDGEIKGFRNLDTSQTHIPNFISTKVAQMKSENEPIVIEYSEGEFDVIYYENSKLLNQLRIYPYFQLGVIAIFLGMSYFAFSYSRTSEQNKVWAGMSKETAHQLGTPISSLMGWLDYLREREGDVKVPDKVLVEMQHDMDRLGLITERFSKIGSEPSLTVYNLYEVLEESVSYINSRTSQKVEISIKNIEIFQTINVAVNKPLFAWVVENLCKNAVDAMDGEGAIWFEVSGTGDEMIQFDAVDTGKGIPANRHTTIFKPGYTTKKRGWGLGLSLVKRIIENYHSGKIYVQSSEVGKGTRFRIELRKA
jgi:two-component system, sporulation sensor kinase D